MAFKLMPPPTTLPLGVKVIFCSNEYYVLKIHCCKLDHYFLY